MVLGRMDEAHSGAHVLLCPQREFLQALRLRQLGSHANRMVGFPHTIPGHLTSSVCQSCHGETESRNSKFLLILKAYTCLYTWMNLQEPRQPNSTIPCAWVRKIIAYRVPVARCRLQRVSCLCCSSCFWNGWHS